MGRQPLTPKILPSQRGALALLCVVVGTVVSGVPSIVRAVDDAAETAYRKGLAVLQGNNGAAPDDAQAQARRHFGTAAALHHPDAEMELGFLEEDPARATAWFREAASHGNSEAQYNFGVAYAMGHGVEHDAGKAVELFERAALQRFPDAVYNLAIMHINGDGIPRDRILGCGLLAAAKILGVETELGAQEDCATLSAQERLKAERITQDPRFWSRRQ